MTKGSSPAGNMTATTVNPTQQAQLPFLQNLWARAGQEPNPIQYYPGQTLADFDPSMSAGYNAMIGAGNQNNQFTVPAANNLFSSAANGGMGINNSPALAGLQGIIGGTSAPQQGLDWQAQQLAGIGANAQGWGQGYAGSIGALAGSAPGSTQGAANYLASLAPSAVGAASNYAGQLTHAANGTQGSMAPSLSQLYSIAGEAGDNPALASLSAAANGKFLGANPYLEGQFKAASQPLVNQYMTATAPQTDSNFEAAGRYGSGAHANAQSVNEQNLGTALGNLSANLYGQDYANERNLMTSAAGELGNLYLGDLGAGTTAATAAGNLGLGASQAQIAGLGQAAGTAATGYQNAGNLAATGANTGLAGINTGLTGLSAAAGTQNTGYQTAADAATKAGGLNLGNMSAINQALAALQGGYQSGNTTAMQALALEPQVLQGGLTSANAIEQGGQGLTSMSQSQIQDAMNRFYGNTQAPWQTLTQYANLIGQPTSGSASTTQPYFTNPMASLLGGGLGAASLSQSLTGQSLGGLLGINSLFGGAGGAAAAGVDPAIFAGGITGSLAPDLFGGAAGAAAADAGGGGLLAGLLSFFSDRRLKEDIHQVGRIDDLGLPVYSYRYRGSDVPQMGVMADEAERVRPDAVMDTPSGYKAVDYARLLMS